jgi:hypothetical protein
MFGMDFLRPVLSQGSEERDQALMAELLEALQRMVRRGHLPSSLLLVQLTDGRVRLDVTIADRSEAQQRLSRVCNEYGPARIALWISVERQGPAVQLAIERLTGAACKLETGLWLTPRPQAFAAGEGSAGCSDDRSASSRKRAIREASFGMTTGRLPKVDWSWLPSGARSSPVW